MSNPISLVEFVCIGNNGRSPFGEAFARQFLFEHSVTQYSAISSGLKVDATAKKEMSDADCLNYLRIAHERGIMHSVQVQLMKVVDYILLCGQTELWNFLGAKKRSIVTKLQKN